MSKSKLLKECVEILKVPKVQQWYAENLESRSQSESLNMLEKAVSSGTLTAREALAIMLVVGVQWRDRFEGVP